MEHVVQSTYCPTGTTEAVDSDNQPFLANLNEQMRLLKLPKYKKKICKPLKVQAYTFVFCSARVNFPFCRTCQRLKVQLQAVQLKQASTSRRTGY